MKLGAACRSLLAALPAIVWGATQNYYYRYFSADGLDHGVWVQNGTVHVMNGLWMPTSNGGSLISTLTPPGEFGEVRVRWWITASGGTYILYLRASPDALSGPAPQGTYYAVELQNPVVSGGTCTGTVAVLKRVNGVVTLLGSTVAPCPYSFEMRSVVRNDRILVYAGSTLLLSLNDSSIPIGQPGIGGRDMPSGNVLGDGGFWTLDTVPPVALDRAAIGVSEYPTSVRLQWQPAADDPGGVGVYGYYLYRNGTLVTLTTGTQWIDSAVSPSTTYTYTIQPVDFHWSMAPATQFQVTTPAVGGVDLRGAWGPRRVGVRAHGSYRGGLGERIDLLSGNLNFSLPLLRPQGRGGWTVPLGLSYNSQNWLKDSGGTWKLGDDTGYGFGWRLMAGALIPYWSDPNTLAHYTFIDATGAEYRLDVNTNGVWRSREGLYVWYDQNWGRLYFPDGSFWVMGSVASSGEPDAGGAHAHVRL